MEDIIDIGGLGKHFNKRTPEEKAIRLASFFYILEGKKAIVNELALQVGITEQQAQQYIENMARDGRLVIDEQGTVVGSHGLSLIPTKHSLNINGQNLFTWCAADAIGIPAALGIDAKIISNCFQCNEPIEIIMSNGDVQSSNHANARMWVIEADLDRPVVSCTCPQINFFCSTEHFNKWNKVPNIKGRLLTLAEGVKLGNCWWNDIKQTTPYFSHPLKVKERHV